MVRALTIVLWRIAGVLGAGIAGWALVLWGAGQVPQATVAAAKAAVRAALNERDPVFSEVMFYETAANEWVCGAVLIPRNGYRARFAYGAALRQLRIARAESAEASGLDTTCRFIRDMEIEHRRLP